MCHILTAACSAGTDLQKASAFRAAMMLHLRTKTALKIGLNKSKSNDPRPRVVGENGCTNTDASVKV